MRKFKVWRQILASALALVIVFGMSLNVKAATGIYAISNRENANKLGTFAYQIGEVVYPGDKPRDGGSNSTYYFYKYDSINTLSTYCDENGEVLDGNDMFVSVVLTGFCFSSSSISNADINTKYIPEPSGDYAAWELQLISIATNGFRSYYFVPCGTKPAPSPAPNEDSVYYDPLSSAIDVAIANGSNETIEWSAGDSLPKEIVEKVINNPGITIHFTYTYEGVEYDLYLNSENLSKIYKDGIPWFGPLCLAACNGAYSGNGYVVKEGDTLGAIAAMMNTTIDAIMAKNPEITDPNVIYIGQVIK